MEMFIPRQERVTHASPVSRYHEEVEDYAHSLYKKKDILSPLHLFMEDICAYLLRRSRNVDRESTSHSHYLFYHFIEISEVTLRTAQHWKGSKEVNAGWKTH